jgi:type IV pilus assembly protein PilE
MNLLLDTAGKLTRMPAGAGVGRAAGFTLIELMMVVAVVGILGAIALPSYRDFVIRGRIPDATSTLAAKRVQMEQFFQDNRMYIVGGVNAPPCNTDTGKYFTFSCSAIAAASYTLQAVGTGPMAGFNYTINEANIQTTGAVPSGWSLPSPNNCWVTKKGGIC